jgi:hypothetical protein
MFVVLDKPIAWPLNWTGPYALRGLGASGPLTPGQQSAEGTVSVVAGAVGTGVALAAAIPGVVTTALVPGLIAASAVPIIGAAIAAVTLIIVEIIANSGCGQTCIETSQWANQAEQGLIQNIQAYFGNTPRYQSQQALALANFDAIWAQLQAICGGAGTGDAGKRCITDRQRGACTWQQSSTSALLGYPGEPQTGCWNWFNGYRDPIANDPDVQPDDSVSTVAAALSSGGSAATSASTPGTAAASTPTWIWLALGALGIWTVYEFTK